MVHFLPKLNKDVLVALVNSMRSVGRLRLITATVWIILFSLTATSYAQTYNPATTDSDGDGIVDSLDLDDDNDGILDTAENPCQATPRAWANWSSASTGVITTTGGSSFTVTRTGTAAVGLAGSLWNPTVLGAYDSSIPQGATPALSGVGSMTFNFSAPVTNPIFYFASLGAPSVSVPITFSSPFNIIYNGGGFTVSGNTITGAEGYGAVQFLGTFTSISVSVGVAENSTHFGWGIPNICSQAQTDVDGDGIPNELDLDSDGDGCSDAIEGGAAFTTANLVSSTMAGGSTNIKTNLGTNVSSATATYGVPTIAGTGQSIGVSQNTNLNECTDTDNDGVADIYDLDDDNDGILDIYEDCSASLVLNEFQGTFGFTDVCRPSSSTVSSGYTFDCLGNAAGQYRVMSGVVPSSNVAFAVFNGHTTGFSTDAYLWANGSTAVGVFYSGQFTVNTAGAYNYGAWAINADKPGTNNPLPNIGIRIVNATTSAVVSTTSTGNLPENLTWQLGQGTVTLAPGTYRLEAYNVSTSSGGNDFAIDDVFVKSVVCNNDLDGDGIPNRLDLDSDGDGCPDAVEGGANISRGQLVNSTMAGGNSGANFNGTSAQPVTQNLCNSTACVGSTSATMGVPTVAGTGQNIGTSQDKTQLDIYCNAIDSDGDGVVDFDDLDDDNDGILDTVECPQSVPYKVYTYNRNNDGTIATNVPFIITGQTSQTTVVNQTIAGTDLTYGGVNWKLIASNVFPDATGKISVAMQPNASTTGAYAFADAVLISNGVGTNTIIDNNTAGYSQTGTWIAQTLAGNYNTTLSYVLAANYATASATWSFTGISTTCDLDGDGIPNNLDLDSDGDGCADAIEGGANFTKANITAAGALTGTVSSATATYGVPTIASTGQTVLYSQNAAVNACTDTDGDGIADVDDLDDDNDGILDTVEGLTCVQTILTREFNGTFGTISAATKYRDLQQPVSTPYTYTVPTNTNAGQYVVTSKAYGQWFPQYTTGLVGHTTGLDDDAYLLVNGATSVGTFYQETVNVVPNTNYTASVWTRNWTGAGSPAGDPTIALNVYDATGTTLLGQAIVANFTISQGWINAAATINTGTNTQVVVKLQNLSVQSGGNDFAIDDFAFGRTDGSSLTCTSIDTDGDGIPDYLDLDSDADGCPDAIEGGAAFTTSNLVSSTMAGGSTNVKTTLPTPVGSTTATMGVPTIAGTGQAIGVSTTSAVNGCTDTDGDGIVDLDDLDDDNDGILDTVECVPTNLVPNGDFSSGLTGWTNGGGWTASSGGAANITDNAAAQSLKQSITGLNTTNTGGTIKLSLFVAANNINSTAAYLNLVLGGTWYGQFRMQSGVLDFVSYGGASANITPVSIVNNSTGFISNAVITIPWVGKPNTADLDFQFTASQSDFSIDNVTIQSIPACDTDGDGIPNYLDLDSDADGCPDAVEGGANFTLSQLVSSTIAGGSTNVKTTLPTPVGSTSATMGVPTLAGTGQTVGISQNAGQNECTDTDGDGVADMYDLDDDNDGILDTDEDNCNLVFENFGTGTAPAIPNANVLVASTEASIVSAIPTHPAGAWLSGGLDYTPGDVNGNMLIFTNVSTPKVVYAKTMSGLTVGRKYTYSAFITNIMAGGSWIPANVTMRVLDNTGKIIGLLNTGNLTIGSINWKKYSIDFVAPTTSVTLDIIHNATATGNTNGEDFALDDIGFGFCDLDGDGIPNSLDLDSDADGCPDAVEGGAAFTTSNLVSSTMAGGSTNEKRNLGNTVGNTTTTMGVPTIAGTGQTIGTSQSATVQDAACPPPCSATLAPALSATTKANTCPATTIDLSTITVSNRPASSTLTWHTGTPATAANRITAITSVSAGTYYAAFFDATANCYSGTAVTPVTATTTVCCSATLAPALSATTKANACPATTIDLSTITATNTPANAVLSWHSGTPATAANRITSVSAVSAGTYYAAFFDATANCYSGSAVTPVTANTVACCQSGTIAPALSATSKANVCPATTIDLSTITASNTPAGTTLSWHTGTPATSANRITAITSVSAGTYYAAFFDAVANCYSGSGTAVTPVTATTTACCSATLAPALSATTKTNACPATTIDLSTITVSNRPASSTLTWHTGTPATAANRITAITSVSAGTYYAAFFDATANCYSGTAVTPVTATTVACCQVGSVAPALSAQTKTNSCPATTIDLSTITASNTPAGTTLSWHTGSPATAANRITSITSVTAGIYYAAFYDAAANCYSNLAVTPVLASTVACCQVGSVAPALSAQTKTNSCPATKVDLSTITVSNTPAGTSMTWHTGSPATAANRITSITSVTAGIYYAAFYDATANCYSNFAVTPVFASTVACCQSGTTAPALSATTKTNTCPTTTIDLSTITASNLPAGATLSWHTGSPATAANRVTNVSALPAGTYYAAFFDATNNCFSGTGFAVTPVTATTVACCPNPSVGGSLTLVGTLPLCSVSNQGVFSLSGQTGTVVKWQTSTNGGGIWTDISGTAGLTQYSFSNAQNNQQFRAVVNNGGSCSDATSTVLSTPTSSSACSVDCDVKPGTILKN